MKKINVAKNDNGKRSIQIAKDIHISELNEICAYLNNRLMEISDYSIMTDIYISDKFLCLRICVFDEKYNLVGYVEFLNGDKYPDYYELIPKTKAEIHHKGTEKEWDEFANRIISDTFKFLRK